MLQFRVSEVDFDQHYFKVGGLQLHEISDRQSDTKVWNGNKAKDYCALCERCFHEKKQVWKTHEITFELLKWSCVLIVFFGRKWFWWDWRGWLWGYSCMWWWCSQSFCVHLKWRFLMNVGLTEVREDVSEHALCNERKKTRFKHLKKGSKRMSMISVTSVINMSKY